MKQERLTLEEMRLKYPDQWLFITDCELCGNSELIGGVVSVASKYRDQVFKASRDYKGSAAIRWTGKIPQGTVFLL